jgi:hypothetical protein
VPVEEPSTASKTDVYHPVALMAPRNVGQTNRSSLIDFGVGR